MTATEDTEDLVCVPGKPPIQFPGHLLGEVSTQIRDQPRWLEISLYKVTDSTRSPYVLHLCGASVVYHKHDGPCNTGVPTAASGMPVDAEPCKLCHPGTIPSMDGDDLDLLWDLEQDRYTTYKCRNAEEVVERLRKPRNRKQHDDGGTLSAPAQRLLDLVAPKDEKIAETIYAVERI